MAFAIGNNGYLKLGSSALTGYITSGEFSASTEEHDVTTWGNDSKNFILGLSETMLTLNGLYDAQALVNEVQTLSATGTVDGGQYKLRFDGQTTSDLNHNASNATILSALNALNNIAPGDVVLGGGALPGTPVTITFAQNYAGFDVPLMTVQAGTSPLTGGGSYGVVQTTAGAGGPDAIFNTHRLSKALVSFIYGPVGSTAGMPRYSGNCYVTNYTISSPVGDVVSFTADLRISGDVTRDTF